MEQYPLHLMNLASLQDLDSLIAKDENLKELDIRRFRSNIIGTSARSLFTFFLPFFFRGFSPTCALA